MSLNVAPEFLTATVDEQLCAERIVAHARAVLALSALLAFALDPTKPPSHTHLTFTLLGAYSAYACVVLAVVRTRAESWPLSPAAEHAIDVVLAIAVTQMTQGTSSPLFVLFPFTLLAAAYRWGYRETLATAAVGIVCVVVESAVQMSTAGSLAPLEMTRLIMRSMYMLVAGMLTAYLARAEKQARREGMSIAAIMSKADVRIGLKGTLTEVFRAMLQLLGARRIVLVVRPPHSAMTFAWDLDAATAAQGVRVSPIEPAQFDQHLAGPGAAWHGIRRVDRHGHARFDIAAVDRTGAPQAAEGWTPPESLGDILGPWRQLLAVDLPGDVAGRLFIIDARPPADRSAALRFGQRLVALFAPSVYNVYLLSRLRSRAAADERARVSRELHDGIVQAILGVQIQLHALSLRSAEQSPEIAGEVTRIDGVLRQESMKLRELMQQMKPVDVGPDDLVDALADLVGRFQRETGISARFISKLSHVELPAWACREITRIVQEALVNVRKHSGARNVYVRFGRDIGDRTVLSITDDGRGLGFAGRRDHAERKGARVGPGVISERVRLLGGDLVVESYPERGTQLEIAVPRLHHAINQ